MFFVVINNVERKQIVTQILKATFNQYRNATADLYKG